MHIKSIVKMVIFLFIAIVPRNAFANDAAPEFEWTKYIGGSHVDNLKNITLDNDGGIYISGLTHSPDIEGHINRFQGGRDGFISRISAVGEVVWATYLEASPDIAFITHDVDEVGNVFFAGITISGNLPKLLNEPKSRTYIINGHQINPPDTFLGKISSHGEIEWMKFIGGSYLDDIRNGGIIISPGGDIYLSGVTKSHDFEKRLNEKNEQRDAFVIRMSREGDTIWTRYIGGEGDESEARLSLAPNGDIVIAGQTSSEDLPQRTNSYTGERDVFVASLSCSGEVRWTTYIGGEGEEYSNNITADADGNIYVAGWSRKIIHPRSRTHTDPFSPLQQDKDLEDQANVIEDWLPESINQPFINASFISKLNPDGSIEWSIYMIGSIRSIQIDSKSQILISGRTHREDLPGNLNELTGNFDAFIMRLTYEGQIQWALYIGGRGEEGPGLMTLKNDSVLFVAADTLSKDMPNSLNEFHVAEEDDDRLFRDIFLSRIRLPEIRDEAVVGEDGVDENGDE